MMVSRDEVAVGEDELAGRHYRKAYELDKDYTKAMYSLARVREENGKADGAGAVEQLIDFVADADGAPLPPVRLAGVTGGPGGVAALASDWQAPLRILLSPAVGALLMSLSTVIVAINAQLLRRVELGT